MGITCLWMGGVPSWLTGNSLRRTTRRSGKNYRRKGTRSKGEFGCAGWNTNRFLKYFGGLNKGRPDAEDIRNAEAFARDMKEKAQR